MKVFIVGGRGNIGQEVALGLIKQEGIEKIILGDIDIDPAGLRDRLRINKKISLIKIDATDHGGLAGMLKDADVAVNCAGPFYKTAAAVARAAVTAKVDCIDVCDDYEAVETLYASEIDKAAREAGITVLTGMGSDPGTNNIIAKWYAQRLDKVDEISLFWAVSITGLAGAALEHSLHMTAGKIPQFLDSTPAYVEGGTGEETVQFPDPLGACMVRYVGHPQPLTMPRYIKGLKNVIVKGGILPASQEDRGSSVSGLKVIVKGERKGKQVTCTAEMVGGMGPGTGISASIAVRMLSAGDIKVKGLVAPEGCIDPERFLAALLKSGARIYQTETVTSVLEEKDER